jgi:hypothetical protein
VPLALLLPVLSAAQFVSPRLAALLVYFQTMFEKILGCIGIATQMHRLAVMAIHPNQSIGQRLYGPPRLDVWQNNQILYMTLAQVG